MSADNRMARVAATSAIRRALVEVVSAMDALEILGLGRSRKQLKVQHARLSVLLADIRSAAVLGVTP